MSDALFSQVKLLLFCDGTNGSTTFTDSSWGNRTVTANGNAQITTTSPKFGTGAALFDGTADRLSVPTSTDFDVGSGDFTMELWLNAASSANAAVLAARRAGAASFGKHVLYIETDNTLRFVHSLNLTSWDVNINTGTNVRDGTYKHIAVNKTGNVYTIYVDGVSVGTQTTSGACAASTEPFSIGGYDDGSLTLNGRIDSFRFTVGTGRYPTAFTAPTAEFELGATGSMTAALVSPLIAVALFGGASITLSSPPFSASLFTGMQAALTAPAFSTGMVFGGGANLNSPGFVASLVGHDATGENSFSVNSPRFTATLFTGAVAKLNSPSPSLSASMTGVGVITANLSSPAFTLSATSLGSPWSMTADLRSPAPSLLAYGGGTAFLSSPGFTFSGSMTTGGVMTGLLTSPGFDMSASVSRGGTLTALLTAPRIVPVSSMQVVLRSPPFTLSATGRSSLAPTYVAYSINLLHDEPKPGDEAPVNEVTRYTNYPFDRIVRYKNSYYGINSTGLYLIGAATDNGTAISWGVKTHITDFKSEQKKSVESMYVGGRLPAATTFTVYTGEKGTNAYSFTTPRGATAQNYRQKFGRGMRERYYAFEISGSGAVTIDTLTLNKGVLSRKV